MGPNWGWNPPPMHVPRQGTEPLTFLVYGRALQPTEPPSLGSLHAFQQKKLKCEEQREYCTIEEGPV